MSSYSLTCHDGHDYKIQEKTALVFIDETGEENLSDSKYPIFGFGGCLILAKDYRTEILEPWKHMKETYFSKIKGALHASNLRNPTNEQLNALNSFFSTYRFGRFATLISDKTVFDLQYNLFQIATASLYQRINDILRNTDFKNVVMIFEESERINHLYEQYFSSFNIEEDVNGNKGNIEVERYFMKKSSSEPGLEVADFIIHSSGTTVRDKLSGKINRLLMRPDFSNIFNRVDKTLASFIEINRVAKE